MRIAVLIGLVFSVAGCAIPVGTEAVMQLDRYERAQVDVSSREDIYYLYGQPHEVGADGDASIWRYYSARGSMDAWTLVPVVGLARNGTNYDGYGLEFVFSDAGVLARKRQTDLDFYSSSFTGWRGLWSPHQVTDPVEREMNRLGLPYDAELAQQMAPFVLGVWASRQQALQPTP
jgi:hypothetical protein